MSRIFYGIPFAQPPVAIIKWDPKIINATQPQPSAPSSKSMIKTPTLFLVSL